jgi:putative ABC transport system substrate-binding protein
MRPCRRRFLRGGLGLAGLGLLAGCSRLSYLGQQPAKVPRVGVLFPGPRPAESAPTPRLDALRDGLRALGRVEGQGIAIEPRWSDHVDQLADAAAELVRLPADVIVVESVAAIRAAAQATATIPIVAIGATPTAVPDRVASFARPGGNVTGLTRQFPGLPGKRLELLKEVAPRSARLAILWDVKALPREEQAGRQQQALLEDAARSLGADLQILDVRSADDLAGAFDAATAGRAEALFVADLPLFHLQAARIARLAAQHRLPAIGPARAYPEAGGLMSYGIDDFDLWRRAAAYVDKVLKGANPGDLPIEQPTTFDFVINLRTAQALGLAIPPTVLAQATEFIQ